MDEGVNITETSPSFIGVDIDHAARVVFAVIGSAMVLSGVSGNWILVTTILKRSKRRSCMHNLFIANLALADMLTLGYWFAFFVLDLVLGYHPVANRTHCVANGMIIAVLSFVSVTSLLSISLNRYLHVCHSSLYSRVFTLPRTVVWCLATWLCGVLLAMPPLWGGAAGEYHYNARAHICSFNRKGLTYPKVVVIVFSTVPLPIIAYFNFAIFRFWKKASMSLKIRFPMAQTEPKAKGKQFGNREVGQNDRENKSDKKDGIPDSADTAGSVPEQAYDVCEEDQPATSVKNRHAPFGDADLGFPTSTHKYESNSPAYKDATNSSVPIASETVAKTDGAGCVAQLHDGGVEPPSTDVEENPTENSSQENETNCSETDETTANNTSQPQFHQRATTKRRSFFQNAFFRASPGDSQQSAGKESPHVPPTTSSLRTNYKPQPSPPKRWKPQKRLQLQQQKLAIQKRLRKSKAREVAFVRSLVIVFILMVIVFVPYFIIVVIDSIIKTPPEVVILGNMMLFLNNAVNYIVYGAMNPTFRKGYIKCLKQILLACCPARRTQAKWFVNASLSSLMTTSLQRCNPDSGLDHSFASQGPTITEE